PATATAFNPGPVSNAGSFNSKGLPGLRASMMKKSGLDTEEGREVRNTIPLFTAMSVAMMPDSPGQEPSVPGEDQSTGGLALHPPPPMASRVAGEVSTLVSCAFCGRDASTCQLMVVVTCLVQGSTSSTSLFSE